MPSTSASIEIAPETIGNILANAKRRLRVPINQRSYAWKTEHVKDLYQDWAAAIADSRDEYFLGSLVVVATNDGVEVFDGQQRLATSTILIAAIRDHFLRAGDEKTASLIERDSLFSEDRATHELTPHFRLNAEDQDFFYKRILCRPDDPMRKAAKTDPQKDSHKRIDAAAAEAAVHVKGIVGALPESDWSKQLNRWLDFIERSARVVWVQVADEPTAFTIFETMNDRGLRLSSADLLKNYIYAIAEERKPEAIQKWQSMCGTLESIEGEDSEVVDYVRCFWVASHGPTRSKDLYNDIKREVNNKTKAVSLASALEARSQDYAAILTSSYDVWSTYGPGVKAGIETLRALGVSQVRPLLLAAFGKLPDKEFVKLIDTCVCWSVRCLLSGVPSGTLEGYYARNAHKISQGKIKTVAQLTTEMLQIIPDDNRFKAAAATVNVANAQLARYYLRALQREADGEEEPQYVPSDGREITLEHVMPSKPGAGWGHVKPEDAKANCNRLGNQVLLPGSVNSQLGNCDYASKRKALKASRFSLTKEAAGASTWGIAEISNRQERLAQLAVATWPLKSK